jgi:hypothetical protein
MPDNLNVHGGVLIIGSLLWQPNLGNTDNTIRKDWRDNCLKMPSKIAVNAPIRYGRQSGGGVYTMTFSNTCRKKPGNAFVAAFRNNPVKTYEDLLREAIELSRAEGMGRKFIEAGSAGIWGVLGILFNENCIEKAKKAAILAWWETKLRAEPLYPDFHYKDFRLGTESPCILQNGNLNFPWITAVNAKDNKRLNELDFLLATATMPTNIKYPSVQKMVSNVQTETGRKYFKNNNTRGIVTHQDERILKKL